MKIRKSHAAWAVKLWVLGTVFLLPFVGPAEILGWLMLGGIFALVWKRLPEEPEAPVDPLPFAREYSGREIPRRPSTRDKDL
jgi:hypothetical protein